MPGRVDDLGVLFFAGATFRDLGVSLFVACTIFGEIWTAGARNIALESAAHWKWRFNCFLCVLDCNFASQVQYFLRLQGDACCSAFSLSGFLSFSVCIFSLCVFCLYFLSVFFLSVFSVCVFCLCFSVSVFCLRFRSVFSTAFFVCVFYVFSFCVFCLFFFACTSYY